MAKSAGNKKLAHSHKGHLGNGSSSALEKIAAFSVSISSENNEFSGAIKSADIRTQLDVLNLASEAMLSKTLERESIE